MDKYNLPKITKISYVFIFGCLTYYLLIGNSTIGNWAGNVIQEKLTQHWYQKCPNNFGSAYTFKGCEGRGHTTLELDGKSVNIFSKDFSDWEVVEWNKKRKPDEFIWVYRNNSIEKYTIAKRYSKRIVWGIFLISLALIWISRSKSIPILNKIMSLIKTGWKKI